MSTDPRVRKYYGDVLVVDDLPDNLKILSEMLTRRGYQVRPAINGELALRAVQNQRPDLILLDVMMPVMDGFEVCNALKADEQTRSIPIIFISAVHEELDKVRAFDLGAVDYITKPFQLREVLARVRTHLMLDQQRRKIESLVNFKNLLIRTVSHDLKNPIGSIMGYSELLLVNEVKVDVERQRQFLQRIYSNADHMHGLVKGLLDLARLEEGIGESKMALPLEALITAQILRLRPQAEEKQQRLIWRRPSADTAVCVEPDLMARVIDNLLTNAIKYTPVGGEITVWVEIELEWLTFHISDTGFGVPAAAVDHLFEHFYRVETEQHAAVAGTGLGLAIAREIVMHHDGRIWVESEEGAGSTFSVSLPRKVAVERMASSYPDIPSRLPT